VVGDRPVSVAVVGLGYWGPNLLRNLAELPESEPVYACALHADVFGAVRRRYPAVDVTTDYEAVLADPRVEAVAIATPVSTHYALALAALRGGKHVLVEKPIAGSETEAQELIDVAATAQLVLMSGHTFVYSPPVNLVRGLLQDGELGDVYFVSMSRVNLGLHQHDVSVVWDLGPTTSRSCATASTSRRPSSPPPRARA
jgi:predicted dehydrogenase